MCYDTIVEICRLASLIYLAEPMKKLKEVRTDTEQPKTWPIFEDTQRLMRFHTQRESEIVVDSTSYKQVWRISSRAAKL